MSEESQRECTELLDKTYVNEETLVEDLQGDGFNTLLHSTHQGLIVQLADALELPRNIPKSRAILSILAGRLVETPRGKREAYVGPLKKGLTLDEVMSRNNAELEQFCAKNKLKKGNKAFMASHIVEFLNGEEVVPPRKLEKEFDEADIPKAKAKKAKRVEFAEKKQEEALEEKTEEEEDKKEKRTKNKKRKAPKIDTKKSVKKAATEKKVEEVEDEEVKPKDTKKTAKKVEEKKKADEAKKDVKKSAPKKTKKEEVEKVEENKEEEEEEQEEQVTPARKPKKGQKEEKMCVALTGHTKVSRAELRKKIVEKKGVYVDDITQATHLICNDISYSTEKLLYARKNGILILHESYFH